MGTAIQTPEKRFSRLPLNIAIVGGGRACKFFLELIQNNTFPYLNLNLVGVCDINPGAEGYRLAREMGIYTCHDFRDLFELKNLDGIIELTNDHKLLLELIEHRPNRVGVVEHNIGRLLRRLFRINQDLEKSRQEAMLEKMSSDFLIQQSNAAIVVLNTDFTIAEANEAYLKRVAKSKAQVLGEFCYQVLHGLSDPCAVAHPTLKCPMVETLRTRKSAHVIHEFPMGTDTERIDNIVTYPLLDENGEIIRIFEIWRDITETLNSHWEKRAAVFKADLNRMVQEDRMISLGKLVASCVHEINNPIQGMLTFSALMQNALSKESPSPADLTQFSEFLGLMTHELERCGGIVSGLLSFSRQTPLEYKPIDLSEVLTSVFRLTRHKMELQGIQLDLDPPAPNITIRGDANHLQQCFLNLIFNSMEAMPEGGRLALESALDSEKSKIHIRLTDTGSGIEAAHRDHIFDPFFTTKPEGQGTGMGLSIVYGVVKNHGGEIQLQSEPGKGTTFDLVFPTL